jgi:choice-of-anchor A domain-containing protein
MNKSTTLLNSVALLSLAMAFGGCGSSAASGAPDGTGAALGGPSTGNGASNGTAGTGASGPDINPFGNNATQGAGGDTTGLTGGTQGQSGNGSGATGATGATGNDGGTNGTGAVNTGASNTGASNTGAAAPTGGSRIFDPGTGGNGTTIDQSGGQGTTIDQSGGVGTTVDQSGGVGTTVDQSGGRGTQIDIFGGTGNTTDQTGGVGTPPPPPPPDAGTPGCVPTWFAKKINVLVLNNANVSNADTRGAMWVGGNLTGVGYDVGGDLPADPSCQRLDLAVGGNLALSGYLTLHNGAAAYGGSITVSGVTSPVCGISKNPANMPNFTQIATDVKGNSSYFNSLPDTGTVNGTTFNGASAKCKIVVFHTSLCSFAGVTISLPPDGTAIINSTCTAPTFTNGQTTVVMGGVTQPQCNGQQGTGGACNHILYNFPNATTVTVSGMSAQGSILAPFAKFLGNGGNVAGEVVVDSMDTGIEFHAWFFEGCLDTTTC